MVEHFIDAFALMVTFKNVFFAGIGCFVGIVVGAIPGMTATMAIALLVPLTFTMEPVTAIATLVGVYKGGMFGGSIPAILINTPGTPAASATGLDGYPMAKKGQALKALKIALYASVIGNLITDVILVLVAPPLARAALKLGAPELFSLILFSLTIIAAVSGDSLLKGLIGASLGLLIATVGIDPVAGSARFSFGTMEMLKGVGLLPMLIGLFAISELFFQVDSGLFAKGSEAKRVVKYSNKPEDNSLTLKELLGSLKTIIRGSALGAFIGAIPGLGSTITAFLSYGMAKKGSKRGDEFGSGVVEGVAAAESGNSAVCGSALIPLLTLGIPGDIVTAILLGAFMIKGITPGPLIFQENGNVVYALFIGLFICTFLNLVLGRILINGAKLILKIPANILFSIIIVLCFIGTYAVDNSLFDVKVMLIFGLLGYFMRRFGFPLAPLLVAFVLEPMLENGFRQAMGMSFGSPVIFFARPISLILILLTIITVGTIIFRQVKNNRQPLY
ncbi:tripartite tricarboxylate transporter permease [Desulfospira joergensenii]|uniref:tripartite tricarboxylate transporter permease n=1 Tax=Desulfospira joergensenii TaxID=53329 RepID=UPI0003B45123|nr:tripartite tricarboxylate transporter permease [Desulfospira joergensenii]